MRAQEQEGYISWMGALLAAVVPWNSNSRVVVILLFFSSWKFLDASHYHFFHQACFFTSSSPKIKNATNTENQCVIKDFVLLTCDQEL